MGKQGVTAEIFLGDCRYDQCEPCPLKRLPAAVFDNAYQAVNSIELQPGFDSNTSDRKVEQAVRRKIHEILGDSSESLATSVAVLDALALRQTKGCKIVEDQGITLKEDTYGKDF